MEADPESRPALAYACLLAAILFCAAPIASSLWLDETATYWVVKDGIANVVTRSWEWSCQSALYYLTAWVSLHLAPYLGLEFALRLPSLLAFAGAAALLYRLGRYLMNARAAMFAALVFVCIPDAAFAAVDARPYALGLALVIASMLCFFRYLNSERIVWGIVYAISAALVVYCHYLFGLALLAQFVYGLRRWKTLAPWWAAAVALCLPLAGQLSNFYRTRGAHSMSATPDVYSFFAAIAPPAIAGALLIAALASRRIVETRHRIYWPYLAAWLIAPPACLFAVSSLTGTGLVMPRYYLSCAPAVALIAGYAISRLSAQRLACLMLTATLAAGIWQAGPLHGTEDWQGVSEALHREARAGDVVLVASGFVEGAGRQIDNPRLREVLFSPELAYPLPRDIREVRLPYGFDAQSVPADLSGATRVFLVIRRAVIAGARVDQQYDYELSRKLPGYRRRTPGAFAGVSIVEFERAP